MSRARSRRIARHIKRSPSLANAPHELPDLNFETMTRCGRIELGVNLRPNSKKREYMRLNVRKLRKFCTFSIDDLFKTTGAEVTNTPWGRYGFIDNGGDVLAVAHLDIVGSLERFQHIYTAKAGIVQSVALDDRLGAYIICDLLPRLGLNYDILLTTGEEVGMSTAAEFATEKEYNWIFEFDRHGKDVVMYQYEDDHMVDLLEDSGFTVGFGSFSDISELDQLGVKGFNFGTGYHKEHTIRCYVDLVDTAHMVNLFASFFAANQAIRYEHTYIDHYAQPWGIKGTKQSKWHDKYYDAYPVDGGTWGTYQDQEAAFNDPSWDLRLPHDRHYNTDRAFWSLAESLWQQYQVILEEMDWETYAHTVGIDPRDAEGWIALDWQVYMQLSEDDAIFNRPVNVYDEFSCDICGNPVKVKDVSKSGQLRGRTYCQKHDEEAGTFWPKPFDKVKSGAK